MCAAIYFPSVPFVAEVQVSRIPGRLSDVLTCVRAVCSWCGRDMGPAYGSNAMLDSHGICPDCQRKLEE